MNNKQKTLNTEILRIQENILHHEENRLFYLDLYIRSNDAEQQSHFLNLVNQYGKMKFENEIYLEELLRERYKLIIVPEGEEFI